MGRVSTKKQIQKGMLSANVAASLIGRSQTFVRSLMNKGVLKPYKIPLTKDRLVSALDVLRLCLDNRIPFHVDLYDSAINYSLVFEKQAVPYIEAAKKNHSLPMEQRNATPQIPNFSKAPVPPKSFTDPTIQPAFTPTGDLVMSDEEVKFLEETKHAPDHAPHLNGP